jgi:hypothetical protein
LTPFERAKEDYLLKRQIVLPESHGDSFEKPIVPMKELQDEAVMEVSIATTR